MGESMYLFKNKITLENREILDKYLGSYEYKTSGLSFSSLYMWRNINYFSWEIFGDYLCIAGMSQLEEDKEEPFLLPPLTKTGFYEPEGLRNSILEAKRVFEECGFVCTLRLVPIQIMEAIKAAFPKEIHIIADRPNYDYLYLTKDLIELSGREFHSKRNHLNYFLNHYDYKYVALTSAMAGKAEQFIKEFNERKNLSGHERELLLMEESAMKDVFHNIEKVGYHAGAILIDDKIEALSIGGNLGKRTVTVHIEKANIEFRGLYQAINNEFSKNVACRVKYINREEDMGILGLRKAKLSYNPIKLVEKYIGVFKADL
ncbi:MAG: phosphatidylglycerol lysyltransferase domain-containing protein [Anaerovorax sp.]|nr:phosphatidylglycerol lysyltransferase domain-containing protein [Anaerovorax sp.]